LIDGNVVTDTIPAGGNEMRSVGWFRGAALLATCGPEALLAATILAPARRGLEPLLTRLFVGKQE